METRAVVRHISAGRENQVQEFPISHYRQLTIGRDPSCEIRYDADRDDLVSRQHARIEVSQTDPPQFEVSDLNSRNGTFVNKQRIFSPVRLSPGDVVQFGAAGPEFQFDVEPPLTGSVRPTRVAEAGGAAVPPTRESQLPGTANPASSSGRGSVGRATVETMLAQNRKNTGVWIAVASLAVVAILGGALFAIPGTRKLLLGQTGTGTTITSLTPKEIATTSSDSVVFFEVGWKLIDIESGHQLNQVYLPNQFRDKKGKQKAFIAGGGAVQIPVFVALGNQIEPMLTSSSEGHFRAIGGRHSGTGMVVSSDGFILTNRHVAATWETSYHFPPEDRFGLLMYLTADPSTPNGLKLQKFVPISSDRFPRGWVPQSAKFLLEGNFDIESVRTFGNNISGKNLEGRNDYMDVTFAKNRLRVPARLVRVSDRHDVAMAKVDLPQSVHKIELNDNYATIQPGDPVTAMGYPGVSPPVYGIVASKDPFNEGQSAHIIPDPTISVGNIGRVLRGQSIPSVTESVESQMGDAYQLTINSTGAGNSGGPVFDDHGRVIGIFSAGAHTDAMITFAVPIRYGMELMGTNKVVY